MVDDKYAVYVVVVEDSEDADMELAMNSASVERVEGDLDYDDAQALADRLATA